MYSCWGVFSPARNVAPHISLHDHPYHRTKRNFLRRVYRNKDVFSVASAEILDSKHTFVNFHIMFVRFALSLTTVPPENVSELIPAARKIEFESCN